jgi:hypothetical protein
LAAMYRMTPHNWHNFLRCHGKVGRLRSSHCRVPGSEAGGLVEVLGMALPLK